VKSASSAAVAAVLASLLLACPPAGDAPVVLESEEQKTAYALGHTLGENLKPLELSEAELVALKQGLVDAAAGTQPLVDLKQYEPKVEELASKRAAKLAADAKVRDADFLAKMAAHEGAQKSDTGLIYIQREEGKGESPNPDAVVRVDYHGTLTDGTVFDSSVRRGKSATFPLNRVIPCWREGVAKMKVGGRATLVCPPEIAYGERGAPPTIPPGATLVFDVTLHEIVKEKKG
jgi:FKBP-type peptidyl-prolyl cis-trans isomerase FkpA